MMGPNPERRALITDTAIKILADVGAGGLTHRIVDNRADLPPGTTSNFFRTRIALLRAVTERVADQHWQYVAELQGAIENPGGRAALATLLSRLLVTPDGPARTRHLARFELFLEGNRWPELRPVLREIHTAALRCAAVVLSSGGIAAAPDRVWVLGQLLNGLVFDRVTMPDTAMDDSSTAELIESLLTAVFGVDAQAASV